MTTLSDLDIKAHLTKGELIEDSDEENIGPACYELRMGSVYYDLTEGDRRIDASAYRTILIKPGHRVVLITQERLVIPNNIIARVVSKGSLFSVGLSPVSTYADPGFKGNLGIVTQNSSEKFIEIPIGEPIAKIDFSRLTSPAVTSYDGQHGFRTEIWPIKHHLQKSYEQIANDPRVESELAESYKILPGPVAKVLRRIDHRQRVSNWAIFVAVLMNAIVLATISTKFLDTTISLAVNLVSTAIVGLVVWLTSRKE